MMAPITRKVELSIDVECPPSAVFAAIVDLPNYNNWLPQSDVFRGTTEISDTPIRTGTKYTEHSSQGTRYGEVRELNEAERHVVFHQPMKLKPNVLGLELDVVVDMVAKEKEGGGCHLEREIRLQIPVLLGLAAGVVARKFEVESWRTMEVLKAFLEKTEAK